MPILLQGSEAISKVKAWKGLRLSVLDVRDEEDHVNGHIPCSVSIPGSELSQRVSELPPQGISIQVVGNTMDQLNDIVEQLKNKRYDTEYMVLWSKELQEGLEKEDYLSTGKVCTDTLWTASPCLAETIEIIEKMLIDSQVIDDLSQAKALDLACGGGRDMVFLGLRNWGKIIGIDYLSQQVDRTIRFINRYNINAEVIQHDLEKDGLLIDRFRDSCHLVTVARYLYRPHFPELKHLIAPGGFLVFHTFMKGCENTTVGRPKREKFLLNYNELAEHFNPDTGFEIIQNEVKNISDGRPTSFFVARKLIN